MFRSTHTASAVSSAAPIFLRRSPRSLNSDSRGNRNCTAISFTVFPEAKLRSKMDSSVVNLVAHPAPPGLAPCPFPAKLPIQCGFGALALFSAALTSVVFTASCVGIVPPLTLKRRNVSAELQFTLRDEGPRHTYLPINRLNR
jgi:hypothetical protein